MIKIDNLSYGYPNKDLYHNISFTLEEGQHCAFIGSSGSGKSTLVDLLMDPEAYMYDGDLLIETERKIGYVSQFSQVDPAMSTTVFDYIAEPFLQLEDQIAKLCDEMATSQDMEVVFEKYEHALDAFDAIGGEGFETTINSQLNLVNLMANKDLKISQLSGGEFKLVQVIKEMMTRPDLIIMDEPDVFLDFDNLNALKQLINGHKGTLLIITHNRYLLDHCFDKVLHLENKEVSEFNGRFIDYNFALLQSKVERQELALADDAELERNEALIERLRESSTKYDDPSKGKSLKARMKIQERLENKRVKAPFVEVKQPEIDLVIDGEVEASLAISIEDYSVAFDESLLDHVNLQIMSTDKVAIIGGNGTGKTTLLREIYKNDHEAIKVKPEVTLAYLSQEQSEILNEGNTIIEEFFDLGFASREAILAYLEGYGFHLEDRQQRIGALSGGEKNLLQLAKIAYSKANMLLLDEPTSHLDTFAQIALEGALKAYKGGVLMVSHDYYSIVNCMDYVLIIEDKNIRQMKMKKFKRMIYANHFDRDYLEKEDKKKAIEMKVAMALKENDFEAAQKELDTLEALIQSM